MAMRKDKPFLSPRGMLLCGGCGDTGGAPQIDKTGHLERAYDFGLRLYEN